MNTININRGIIDVKCGAYHTIIKLISGNEIEYYSFGFNNNNELLLNLHYQIKHFLLSFKIKTEKRIPSKIFSEPKVKMFSEEKGNNDLKSYKNEINCLVSGYIRQYCMPKYMPNDITNIIQRYYHKMFTVFDHKGYSYPSGKYSKHIGINNEQLCVIDANNHVFINGYFKCRNVKHISNGLLTNKDTFMYTYSDELYMVKTYPDYDLKPKLINFVFDSCNVIIDVKCGSGHTIVTTIGSNKINYYSCGFNLRNAGMCLKQIINHISGTAQLYDVSLGIHLIYHWI